LEVYLVSFMVAVFKLISYADVYFNSGLYFFVSLMILNMTMLCEYSNTKYWEYLRNE
ncbi:paraquat-inducible protein A, partial [Pseudoalteromonas sp. Q36-MNA-CIBAN-0048]|uniref:paraquat-inducible protein A n=1 Tax=Pseudoalteromonas sp. Q36-MNA-CIBAN-0048 TaxID=3140479 RepID=UPI00332848C7